MGIYFIMNIESVHAVGGKYVHCGSDVIWHFKSKRGKRKSCVLTWVIMMITKVEINMYKVGHT